jgi:hypothetical protein
VIFTGDLVKMRTIFLTFTTTLAAIAFAGTLFLNTILGTFGLVTTSVESLNKLKSSQLVMDKMKSRHQAKKLNVTKKLAKRSGRRVASASLAAATIGTVAVAVTMTGFEIHDYCEDKASLQVDDNILYGTTGEFNFDECIEEGKVESKRILTEVKQAASERVSDAMNSVAQYSSQQWLALQESNVDTIESTSQTIDALRESAKQWLIE